MPVILLVVAFTATLQVPEPQDRPQLPLVVERTAVIVHDGRPPFTRIEVTVRNVGSHTIVAWGIRGEVRFADDVARGIGSSTDRYASIGRPSRLGGVLPPGGTYAMTTGTPISRTGQPIVAVSAEPTFVIFEDDTALGDERDISWHFRNRELDQRAWPLIESIYAEAIASTRTPLDALHRVRAALEEVTDQDVRNSPAFRTAGPLLDMNLRNSTLDVAKFLQGRVDDTRQRRFAADAHFRRGVPGQENHERALARAVAKWAARRVERYEYTFLERCFCPPAERVPVVFRVAGGRSVLLTTDHPRGARLVGRYDTIDKLFDIIRAAIDKGAFKMSIQYDEELGYPRSVDIDYSEKVADEELRFTVTDVKVLGPQ